MGRTRGLDPQSQPGQPASILSFARLERWQTGYLPVYAAWAAIVVIVFPPLFRYI